MNGSAATNEKFDNYSKVENGLFTYTSNENKLNATTNSNNYINENKLNATTNSNNYINENKLNATMNSNNYIDENKLNTTTDSNNYINENKLNATTDNYSYINENKLNTTTDGYSYIDESLELLNDNSIDPLRRLELKRELVEYISYVKVDEPFVLKEYMKKINDTELMKNFHKYFYYNS